jgi:hypothetical protein
MQVGLEDRWERRHAGDRVLARRVEPELLGVEDEPLRRRGALLVERREATLHNHTPDRSQRPLVVSLGAERLAWRAAERVAVLGERR